MKVSIVLLTLSMITTNVVIAAEKVVITNTAGQVKGIAIVDVKAKVQEIDKETRAITLKKENGGTLSIVAPETVRNFDQIEVNDIIHAKYYTLVEFQVVKEGSPVVGSAVQETLSRAQLGDKPGAKLTRTVAVRANVTKVDPENKTITIQGKDNTLELNVENPEHFKVVKVGDKIDALFTESIAISVAGSKKK
jgi:Cu/Ag efflux protein CusF